VPYGPVIVTQDFASLIFEQNRAHPGDIVHLYMTGLGAVSPPVPSGQPAPLDRLAPAVSPPVCSFNFDGGAARLLFSGLAPGMTGVYQLSVQLPQQVEPFPDDPSRGLVVLNCGAGLDFTDSAIIPVTLQP
jgi:uncharacterized protein (TIGR03437 family)